MTCLFSGFWCVSGLRLGRPVRGYCLRYVGLRGPCCSRSLNLPVYNVQFYKQYSVGTESLLCSLCSVQDMHRNQIH